METEDQLALIGELGCTLIQGYIFGRPMDAVSASVRAHEKTVASNGFMIDRAERRRIMRAFRIVGQGGSAQVRMRNFSSSGAMVEGDMHLEVGHIVELDVGLPVPTEADVRWVKDGRAGVKFAQPIDVHDLLQVKPKSEFRTFVPDYLSSDKAASYADKERLTPGNLNR